MKRRFDWKLFAIFLCVQLILLPFSERILFPPVTRAQLPSFTIDPCGNPGTAKSSVVINLTSATTTQLVALSTGKQIFVCGFSVTMVGAAETLQFEFGTGASCGTGTTTLTGAFADGTASDITLTYGGAFENIFTAPAGNALCALTTGTVGIQGVLTYVQQ